MKAELAAEGEKAASKKDGKVIKDWRQKLMGNQYRHSTDQILGINPEAATEPMHIKSMSSKSKSRPTAATSDQEQEDIGMDFEEGFSDDEDINFGIDDQEEAKEAKKRVFGKGVAGGDIDEDDASLWKNAGARVHDFTLYSNSYIANC